MPSDPFNVVKLQSLMLPVKKALYKVSGFQNNLLNGLFISDGPIESPYPTRLPDKVKVLNNTTCRRT